MTSYHLTIGSQGYLIDVASYRKQAGDQFAGKQAVSTRLYSDLRDVEVWAQQDWSQGRGGHRWDGSPRFAGGSGLNTLTPAQVQSGSAATAITNWNPSPAVATIRGGLVTYKSNLYWATASGGTVYAWQASSEGSAPGVLSIAGSSVGAIAVYKDAVWYGDGVGGKLWKFDPGAATFTLATTLAGTPLGINAMAVYLPSGTTRYLYVGCDYSAGAIVWQWDGTTATQLLTTELASIAHMFVFDGKLYVAGFDAGGSGLLYRFDGTDWALVLVQPDNWIQSGAAFGASYYLGSGRDNRIWRFDGRTLVEVFAGSSPHGSPIRALVAANGVLYAGAAASDTFRTLVASTDGEHWHELRPSGLVAAGSGGRGVRYLGSLNGTLYLAEELASGTGATVYKLDPASYNSSGTLETVRFDAELPSVDKAWRRVTVTHSPLASGQSVSVDYRLDGATSWTSLVSNNTVGSTTSTATFANGTAGREIELRYTLASGGTNTTIVKAVLVEYALVPDTRREWQFDVLLEGTASAPLRTRDGAVESLTGAQLSAALWTSRGTKGTVAFTDLDGSSYRVYFADLVESVGKVGQRDGWQTRARVKLVEA